MRLQKYLAACGVASRRKAEELIVNGKIKVNGKTITQLGSQINPDEDVVTYNQKQLRLSEFVYLMLNKPVGFITTLKDEMSRPTILQLIKIKKRVFPVGRLDCNTSGLLLLINDGALAYKLTHPKHNIFKTYLAKVAGLPKQSELKKFKDGFLLEGKKTKPASIEIIEARQDFSTVKIKISEGRKRQIRKMCEQINHPVIELKRIAIGDLKLDIEVGKYRFLTQNEIDYLKSI